MTTHEAHPMTCREMISLLADYLEFALSPDRVAALERHLAGCEPCQAYLNTYRRTRTLVAKTGGVDMPAEMRDRLRQFLIRALSER